MDINGAFKRTFKLIFGQCNLELDDLKEYLLSYQPPFVMRKSSLSGKQVALCNGNYPASAKFISEDEIDFNKKFNPLGINEIKDMDSLVAAARERLYYAGNKVLGNSNFVTESDTCFDLSFSKYGHNNISSKYIAYSSYIRSNSSFIFGGCYMGRSSHAIHSSAFVDSTRCFESYMTYNSSDMFACYNCRGCTQTMFSFNLRNKKYCIGNLELPKEKYLAIREKLVSESREYIEKNRKFYPVFSLNLCAPRTGALSIPALKSETTDPAPIDLAFKKTCNILFGHEIGPLQQYEKFLSKRIGEIERHKSVFGNETTLPPMFFYAHLPRGRLLNAQEAEVAGKISMDEEKLNGLGTLLQNLGKIALYPSELRLGENRNLIETPFAIDAVSAYKCPNISYSKNCGCSFANNCESVFGCYRSVYSTFCIRCFFATGLTRCSECDACEKCSDCYFCHNCENLQDCILCFNAKNLRYAIGNAEVGKEKYLEFKARLQGWSALSLEREKDLKHDIFNIGSKQAQ
jgi:hypothetical protein